MRVAALVNNAGYSQSGAVEAIPIDRVRAQFETNVFGLLRLTQLVLPGMRRARAGRIVNIGSMGGRLVFPGGGVYHATKYALEALSDALRFEVRGFGIQVVLIEPGVIRTGFGDAAGSAMRDVESSDAYGPLHAEVARLTKEASERGLTARLAGTPDDVAATVEKGAQNAPAPVPVHRVALSRPFHCPAPLPGRSGLGCLSAPGLSVPRGQFYWGVARLIPGFQPRIYRIVRISDIPSPRYPSASGHPALAPPSPSGRASARAVAGG